jgi:L-iditol 2-dehydrogenase
MKAARLVNVNEMMVAEVEKPVPGTHDLLVRVEACGICGSDRHMFKGEYPTARPVTLGHEFSGIIESVGSHVSRFQAGMRVTGDPNIACGHCHACRNGRVNLCEALSAIGVQRDGGFADYVLVPESQAFEIPLSLPPLHGAFCEPLACCLHALDVARIRPGQSVAILGGGVIGLIMVQLVRLAGAGSIVLSTRQKSRRDLATKMGAHFTLDPTGKDVVASIAGPQGFVPGGVDVVLECAGVPDTFSQSLAIAKRGGAVVIFGVMPQGQKVEIQPFDLLVRELRLEAAYLNPFTHGRAAAMVASGVLDLDSLVTRTISLDEVPGEIAGSPSEGDIKIIAVP